jgi:hypothetical protein
MLLTVTVSWDDPDAQGIVEMNITNQDQDTYCSLLVYFSIRSIFWLFCVSSLSTHIFKY